MSRTIKHWTPRYIFDRVALAWSQRAHPDAPWLTSAAVDILNSWLHPTDTGFEWGSGRSTLWFAKRVAHLTSVEHDHNWYDLLSRQLTGPLADKVQYLHRCPGRDYFKAIDTIQPYTLDFVLVDGENRDHCALAAIPKLRPGGYLIIDNINWYLPGCSHAPASRRYADGPASALWREFATIVSSWRMIWTSNGVTDTAFWTKPSPLAEKSPDANVTI